MTSFAHRNCIAMSNSSPTTSHSDATKGFGAKYKAWRKQYLPKQKLADWHSEQAANLRQKLLILPHQAWPRRCLRQRRAQALPKGSWSSIPFTTTYKKQKQEWTMWAPLLASADMRENRLKNKVFIWLFDAYLKQQWWIYPKNGHSHCPYNHPKTYFSKRLACPNPTESNHKHNKGYQNNPFDGIGPLYINEFLGKQRS